MRIFIDQYADGDNFAEETNFDGSVVLRDLLGQCKPGARVSAFGEVACDDTEKGLERLQESLAFLAEEVHKRLDEARKRQGQPAKV